MQMYKGKISRSSSASVASQADTAAVEALLANDEQNMNMERHHLDPDLEAEELNPGGQETLLENNDHVHNVGIPRIAIAPGEGQRPLDVILNVDAELAFPSIYAGIKRQSSETFTTIVRSELRNVDRRGCRTDKLFFNYKKLELIKIRNNISTCLRKRSASSAIAAANVLNEEFMGNLICHDEESLRTAVRASDESSTKEDALRRAMEAENEDNTNEEAIVDEECRALAIPEISEDHNVVNLDDNNHVDEPDSNIRIEKLLSESVDPPFIPCFHSLLINLDRRLRV
ncbi:hypothetical protein ACLKA6_002616 [Drosophila palustris]